MSLTILLLLVFMLLLLFCGWRNKYFVLFACLAAAMAVSMFTLTIEVATDKFAFYHNGEYYEFYPAEHATGKVLLVIEEMHRYHFNTWKNFPWNDWMYEGEERLAPDAPGYGK